ncbi:MAG: hypothetical protein P4L85_07005 [Paludisphaera borealis]|uniref:hypothetical protein n=1 Tax=Paludisphaera borealis TaxID=1387353 RepID=UPI002848D331|nr:hypothetical protein [Paludisphaera borealis]MDR3619084.1 hypothetical protein [Paludisphaera borealis]
MSFSQVERVRESPVDLLAADRGGDGPDWERIHADVQEALEGLRVRVSAAAPGSLSRPGRTSAPAFALFSYRVFYRADVDEDDPILVGVTIQDQGSSYRVAGDVSGEESGRIYFEEACEIAKDAPDLARSVRDFAERLATREAVVIEALSWSTSTMQEDFESEPSRSSDG